MIIQQLNRKGKYNIIWNESLNTYVFENNKELGRVKIMPGDKVEEYEKNLGDVWKSVYNKSAEILENLFVSDKLNSAEILKKSREGDIVFQTSRSNQSAAITAATKSSITHVGILIKHQGRLQVLEAVQPVKITDFNHWKSTK